MPPEELVLRPIRTDDNLKSISLGHEDFVPLKTFLAKNSVLYELNFLARSYVLVNLADAHKGCRVRGYISLVASEIQTTEATHPGNNIHWPNGYSLPAVKLTRMAVDSDLRGQGWGKQMTSWAIAHVQTHISSRIGCRFFVVDAKQSAVGFYEKIGFTMLEATGNKDKPTPVMFIDLMKLKAA